MTLSKSNVSADLASPSEVPSVPAGCPLVEPAIRSDHCTRSIQFAGLNVLQAPSPEYPAAARNQNAVWRAAELQPARLVVGERPRSRYVSVVWASSVPIRQGWPESSNCRAILATAEGRAMASPTKHYRNPIHGTTRLGVHPTLQ